MKIVFIMRHSGYVRNFESTLRLLCDRGHDLHLALHAKDVHPLLDTTDIVQKLCDQYPNFSTGHAPVREDDWGLLAERLRINLDYLRYLNPEYSDAPKLRQRYEREAGKSVVRLAQRGPLSTSAGRRMLAQSLRLMHRAIPASPEIDAFVREHQPDLLVMTPLIVPGSPQTEYIRSARVHGVRTAFCVASWDNLTNKGLIHFPVDLVLVWNEPMKQEAVQFQATPRNQVAVTGAAAFDHWFEWGASTARETFCARVGLRSDRPYLLYLCSSEFVAPHEEPFVRKWVQELRQSSSKALREVGVLVRPHPQNAKQWKNVDLRELMQVAVWPPKGESPVDQSSRAAYFDSIFHSAAVIGINTTAEIESAIVGRRVYTLLAPEFRDSQEGTLHFHHLRRVNGGLLHVAESFAEHLAQLDAALSDPGADDERCRRFVEAFVRPHGIDVPATPKMVVALEELGSKPAPRPVRAPVWAPFVRGPLMASHAARVKQETVRALEAKAARLAAWREKKRLEREELEREQRERKVRERRERERKGKMGNHVEIDTEASSNEPGSHDTVTEQHSRLHDLVAACRVLSQSDRLAFARAVLDFILADVWLEMYGRRERLDYPDAEIYLRVTSKAERKRLKACAKEPFTVEWIHQWVRSGDVFYDVGANVGAYSLVAAKKPSGSARIFAFEPSYANVAALCANIVLNNAAAQITPMPLALSAANALSVFGLRALEPGEARHVLGDGPSEEGPTLYRQPVITYRLDDLIDQFGLPPPNHVKLDVDGGELDILEGAARTLGSADLQSILIEVSTELSNEITRVLEGHGLRLHSRINVKNKAGQYLVWYGLFTREVAGRPSPSPREEQVRVVVR